jgi:signal transduction histidine kinase/CheY-like chemotaxis protein
MSDGRNRSVAGRHGALAARLPHVDWSSTTIGDPAGWPAAWRSTVDLLLDSGFPMCALLGPDLLLVYNEAYVPVLGDKHPAFGLAVAAVFPEIWAEVEPTFERVLRTGDPVRADDRPFLLWRRGFLERCYFTLSFSAIRDDAGVPTGILTTALETTRQVLSERRLDCLNRVASASLDVDCIGGVVQRALAPLAEYEPFVLAAAVHLLHHEGPPHLVNQFGFTDAELSVLSRSALGVTSAAGLSAIGGVTYAAALPAGVALSPRVSLVIKGNPHHPPEESIGFFDVLARHLAAAIGIVQSRQGERDARRAAELASRAKDDFLAMVSHELRSPMTAILGWVSRLRKGGRDPLIVAEAVDVIEHSARTQRHLVDDLLDAAQIASGELRIELDELPTLGGLVGAVVSSWRPAAESLGVRLTYAIGKGVGPVRVDAARIEQVIWNLLTNALKFTPAGGHVDARCEADGDHVVVEVRDSGAGLTEGEPTAAPFNRRRHDVTRRQGLGLGLTIVREIVQQHHGILEAENATPGPGAVFRIRLPIASERSARVAAPPAATSPVPSLHVLLVEDDRAAAAAADRLLRSEGHRVRLATSVVGAEEALRTSRFDVLICDLQLPDGNGLDLLSRVRAAVPHAGSLPAILLTGFTMRADQLAALSVGYVAHVAKPYDAAHLLATLHRVVRRTNPASAT